MEEVTHVDLHELMFHVFFVIAAIVVLGYCINTERKINRVVKDFERLNKHIDECDMLKHAHPHTE